ncbi:MmcQ/YjbR family DNA-binding protein [Staphylococcus gallinarum]|uniref:MmcQ/YjbR family DNA-binding protein n=1 Tax=Staphylococcus gallinarum TaxID=1293 RepID=A0ABQ0Y1R9_STAGA|nr:MmcQ/YjbR family DNA-binding protein [Staphylococcus gallinarum]KIR11677.1 hypothetical protein SH09_04765 [Staphylococcus gallinarum]MCD8899164.1 MmcQ/YjbR family DNA-binding protein [Staphylococcus gallinarum]MCD8902353.1 MmcQ/YjbR family DNA-binding protein [Staphylococcus gallinarum]MCD8908720.1 MmcQ/YjbR family DNA-binding protein [Staphylococcus gallinarum]MCD8919255.1 MmcQ/YjbR family DNA-binding protein [Staphylococcus gallinarum]
MVKRIEVLDYIATKYQIDPDYPWNRYKNYAVCRHNSNNKWFVLIMDVTADKIGLSVDNKIDILNIKVEQAFIGSLRRKKGVYKAYHMDKSNWVSINLSEIASIDEIANWIDDSFDLTC